MSQVRMLPCTLPQLPRCPKQFWAQPGPGGWAWKIQQWVVLPFQRMPRPLHASPQSIAISDPHPYDILFENVKASEIVFNYLGVWSRGLRTTALVQATHVFQSFCVNSKQVSLFPPSFTLIRSHQADRRLFRCALHAKQQQDSMLWVLRPCMTWPAYCATSSHLCSTSVSPSTLRSLVSWDTY